ncbi:MAG: DNA double-strand break repair nuclease NurA [Conexivisphaera sp.]
MIRELLEDAIRLSGELPGRASDRSRLEEAASLWIAYEPSPRELSEAGIDSGWNYRQLQGFYVYAVDAVSVALDSSYVVEPRHEVGASDMSVRIRDRLVHDPNLFLEARGMEFEAALAVESSGRVDLVLLDGSLMARAYDSRSKSVTTLAEAVPELRSLPNAVFVAKRSQGTELLRGPLGDIHYFSRATQRAGFSAPCASQGITHFYVRLGDFTEVLRVEVPGILDGAPPCSEARPEGDWPEVRRVVDSLAHGTVGGYPYVLQQAHERAHVSDEEMRALAELAGAGYAETGREVLGER